MKKIQHGSDHQCKRINKTKPCCPYHDFHKWYKIESLKIFTFKDRIRKICIQ